MGDTKWLRNGFVWIILVIAVIALWFTLVGGDDAPPKVGIGEVAQDVRNGEVARLTQEEDSRKVKVEYKAGSGNEDAETILPAETNLVEVLETYGVNIQQHPDLIEIKP